MASYDMDEVHCDEHDLDPLDESASAGGSRCSTPSVRYSSRCRPVTVESELTDIICLFHNSYRGWVMAFWGVGEEGGKGGKHNDVPRFFKINPRIINCGLGLLITFYRAYHAARKINPRIISILQVRGSFRKFLEGGGGNDEVARNRTLLKTL